MTTIWLVYEAENILRNQFFIDRWLHHGQALGVNICLVTTAELTYGIRNNRPWLAHADGLPLPEACVMRLNQPLLSSHLEAMGIPCFNNSHLAHICNDKRLTHQMLAPMVPSMDTVFLTRGDEPLPFPYPVVVKDALSCGGRGVWLARDEAELQTTLTKIPPGQALAQAMTDTPGRDVRAYVLFGQVIAVMMRVSHTDFRSNIGQGGTAQPFQLSPEDMRMVQDIIARFDVGLIGVDFLFNQGRLVFNEVEDAVGTRMLYEQGQMDVVALYLNGILQRLG